jgi:hypothetical protein
MRLYEITNPEQLDEGPVGKALATAALSLGLSFGNQVNAEEVFVYQDMQGQLQTVSSMWDIPDDVMQSYVVDTDTQKIKFLKKPSQQQQQQQQEPEQKLPQPIEDMKAGVRSMAKDPQSVTFTNFGVYTLSNGKKVYVGYYNAKNSMGGYGGNSLLMYAPSGTGSKFEKGSGLNLRWQPLGMSAMRLNGATVVVPNISDTKGYVGYIDKGRPQDENFKLGIKFILAQWHGDGSMDQDLPKKYKKIVDTDPLFSKATSFQPIGGEQSSASIFGKIGKSKPQQPANSDTPIVDAGGIGVYLDGDRVTVNSTEYSDLQKGDIINKVQYKSEKYTIVSPDGFKQFIDSNKGKKVVVYGSRKGKAFVVAIGL